MSLFWNHWSMQICITLGWSCYAKVDNRTYNVLGYSTAPNNITVQTKTEFTPMRTVISSRAGPVDLVVTFLSPVDTADLTRLSLPFSYLSVSAVSNDGASHTVSVYTDTSGEFVTGDNSLTVKWSTTTENIIVHQMSLQEPITYTGSRQRAQWGTVFLAANRTGYASTLRDLFLNSGVLANTHDDKFRAVDKEWPVMAIAQNLGTVAAQPQVATFVLGHSRNPAVEYYTPTGKQDRTLYFLSKFTSEEDAVRYVVTDYPNALTASTEFDNKVQTDAAKYSPDYASVVAFSTRQAFASMEITLSGTGSGANLQDIKVFTKDAAVDDRGSSREGVLSSVDSLYSIMPMLIYTNANLGNYGLASLLEYAAVSGVESSAVHDLGLRYPRVTSHGQQSRNPLDDQYYTLKRWADYLVGNATFHQEQLTGDWFVTAPAANQTNLALKGLIALKSMVEIQKVVGMTNESSAYENAANSGLEQWIQLSSSGTKYTYQSSQRPQLLHGLYADKLLGLSFVPDSVYAQQRAQWTAGMSGFYIILALALGSLSAPILAQNTANVTCQASPYVLPAVPLVVKSPYSSAWARGPSEIAGQWPNFATGGILGSVCYIKVDNITYTVWGNPSTRANATAQQTFIQASYTYSARYRFDCWADQPILEVLSPAGYLNRLSLPFSYITIAIYVNETDTTEHNYNVSESLARVDHGVHWVTGDKEQPVKWSTEVDNNAIIHKMALQDPSIYAESHQRAHWGTFYFASNQTRFNGTQGDGTTWQTGQDIVVREQFLSSSKLGNTQDTNFRKVSDKWPIMAIAQDFGSVMLGPARTATFVLGHLRNPVVQYQTPTSQEDRSLYFMSQLSTEDDAMLASQTSTTFAAKIITEGEEISPDYMGVLSASTLQAFASMELTIPNATKSIQDPKLFIKDAAVEKDGSSTTASMIIMTYAFMRYTGNAEWAAIHYDTLKTWADYLIDNALFHPSQVTGDWFVGDAAGPAGNMTNVALKGLIALRNAANSGLEQWIQLSDYGTKFTYQSNTKLYLLHGLYADKLLGLNFVPESVYERQRTQYRSGMKRYGVPLTDGSNFTTIAHQFFTIAALRNSTFLGNWTFTAIKNYTEASVNADLVALADTYDAVTGVAAAGSAARGSVGGAYAVLALTKGEVKAIDPIMAPTPNSAGRIPAVNILVTLAAIASSTLLT
ncbi:hypothetical protein B0J17DRAFT_627866 [Rhizoctonia solani]|nr:hypothetical protein B0J17DRAFT_627866 [Rhizoctonia solani]